MYLQRYKNNPETLKMAFKAFYEELNVDWFRVRLCSLALQKTQSRIQSVKAFFYGIIHTRPRPFKLKDRSNKKSLYGFYL